MIFVLGKNEPALFLMFSEADIVEMRKGHTRTVDHHQLGAAHFARAIASLSPSDTASLELLKKVGVHTDKLVHPEPLAGETKCNGCQGVMEFGSLFEGKCIVCWATEAKKAKIASS